MTPFQVMRMRAAGGQTTPGATPFIFWRINVTANNGDPSYLAVQEMELLVDNTDRTSPAAANIAAAASSVFGMQGAALAFDDNTTNNVLGWVSDGSSAGTGWIRWNFGYSGGPGPVAIEALRIWPQPNLVARSPRTFTVQGSNDTVQWTTVAEVNNETRWLSGAPLVFQWAGPAIRSYWQSSVYGGLLATVDNMGDSNSSTGGATNTGSSFIAIDCGAPLLVTSVTLGGGNLSGWGGIASYLNGAKIEYSSDRTTWTLWADVVDVTDSAPVERVFTATPVAARYWRVSRSGYLALSAFKLN